METDGSFYRRERARLLAALTRVFGVENLSLAEDVVQETLARAFEVWSWQGVPEHHSALLMTAAKNRALDVFRRERTRRRFAPALQHLIESEWTLRPVVEELFLPPALQDDELRMIFSCCHPQQPEEARVALVLNLLCGFGVEEIARIYLASNAAIEKRITRGKKVLRESRRLFELTAEDMAPRLSAVHRSLYLLFSEGYHGAGDEAVVRAELCREAMRLVRLLVDHAQVATPATHALAALMYLDAARLPGRTDEVGDLTALAQQDRSRWDRRLIADGLALLERATTGSVISEYHIEAAIAGMHASASCFEDTRWGEIVGLYSMLLLVRPSPVVALNRAMAVAQAEGPTKGLEAISAIDGVERLAAYPFYAAAVGELELECGKPEVARAHFQKALSLARNAAERRLLARRVEDCGCPSRRPLD